MASPSLRAARAVRGLMVDADGYWPDIARFRSGFLASSPDIASQSSAEMPPTNVLGEYVGRLAMAMMSPFVTSMHSTLPHLQSYVSDSCSSAIVLARDSSAAFCTFASMVSCTSEPACGSMPFA